MLKRLLKSWKFWLIIVIAGAGAYLYSNGTIDSWIFQIQLRFTKEGTFEEALKEQEAKEWDYTTDQITANVIGTDLENNTLTVSFIWPPGFINFRFGGVTPVPEQIIKITCPKEESDLNAIRVTKEQTDPGPTGTQLMESGIDIVAEAQSGDSILGYCADEACTEISRYCQLERPIFVEE